MIDALQRLLQQRETCCGFYDTITGNTENTNTPMPVITHDMDSESPEVQGLNPSQITAIQSCKAPLSLIWGPPGTLCDSFIHPSHSRIDVGTGKTTVVVQILRKLLRNSRDNLKILMTASTHNGKLFTVSSAPSTDNATVQRSTMSWSVSSSSTRTKTYLARNKYFEWQLTNPRSTRPYRVIPSTRGLGAM